VIGRIAILGGSSVYIPEFVMSLISHNVNVNQIVLYGRTGKKLEIVGEFCKRLVRKSGFPAELSYTSDLEEAVSGAAYTLNHIRVGGMKARLRDEKLPPQFGMIGDEGVGGGGLSNALRTVPIVLQLAERIEAVNPDTTFINLTNPMGIVMQSLIQCSSLNAVGVCDMPASVLRKAGQLLRCNPSELDFSFIGLDRLGWIQDIKHEDRSVMGTVLEKLADEPDDELDTMVIELFRMVPTRSVSLYFHMGEVVKQQQNMGRHRAEVLHEAEKQILKLYKDKSLSEIPELTRARNAIWYEGTIVPFIMALESEEKRNVILNMRNGKSIRDLPEDASVEIPAAVSREGIEPRLVGSCPRFLKGLFIMIKESDRLAVEAVKHRSYEHALQSLAINPFVPSLEKAKEFLDRVIKEEEIELH